MNMTWTCRCLEYHKFQEIFMHYSIPLECVLCVWVCVCIVSVCFSFLLVWLVSTFDSRFGVCSAWNAKCTMHHKYTRNTHTQHTLSTHTHSAHTRTHMSSVVLHSITKFVSKITLSARARQLASEWVTAREKQGERGSKRERESDCESELERDWENSYKTVNQSRRHETNPDGLRVVYNCWYSMFVGSCSCCCCCGICCCNACCYCYSCCGICCCHCCCRLSGYVVTCS